MPNERMSLIAGRNQAPLTEEQVRRVTNTFLGMEPLVPTRYEGSSRTVFRVSRDCADNEFGEIVFGPDIYPGQSVADPNSALSLKAAVAHELTHFHRWQDLRAISDIAQEHLDEALTSLEAIIRYKSMLNDQDITQLVHDAMQRLRLHSTQPEGGSG